MCSSYQDVGTSGGLAGLVLPVEMSYNRDAESDRIVLGEEYPLLTVRACDGLSWDTPAGI